MPEQLLNEHGTPQRWTDGIPTDELAIVAQEMEVTVEAILPDQELQFESEAHHHGGSAHNIGVDPWQP